MIGGRGGTETIQVTFEEDEDITKGVKLVFIHLALMSLFLPIPLSSISYKLGICGAHSTELTYLNDSRGIYLRNMYSL